MRLCESSLDQMYNKYSPTIITTKSKTCHKTNQTHTDTQQTEIESITSTPAKQKAGENKLKPCKNWIHAKLPAQRERLHIRAVGMTAASEWKLAGSRHKTSGNIRATSARHTHTAAGHREPRHRKKAACC